MGRLMSCALLVACLGAASLRGADWTTHSGDNQRDGWQRDETRLTRDTLKNLQLLWKVKLDVTQRSVYSLFGPLIVERTITDRGFKELAFVATANNDLVAIDADLGTVFWKKHFDWQGDVPESSQASFLCPGGLTAWPVLPPARGRGRGPFAIRPIFLLTGDGYLHQVNINTGDEQGPALKFLPPNGKPYSLAYQ